MITVSALLVALFIAADVLIRPAFGSSMNISTEYVPTGVTDPEMPMSLVYGLVPIILMLPALFFASRLVQGRGVGYLSSATGRLRMRWLGVGLIIAVSIRHQQQRSA